MDGWEIVKTVGTEEEATLVAGYLEGSGVPTEIESLLFHQEPVNFGHLGEVRVLVPTEHRDEALRLLAASEAGHRAGDADDAGDLPDAGDDG